MLLLRGQLGGTGLSTLEQPCVPACDRVIGHSYLMLSSDSQCMLALSVGKVFGDHATRNSQMLIPKNVKSATCLVSDVCGVFLNLPTF